MKSEPLRGLCIRFAPDQLAKLHFLSRLTGESKAYIVRRAVAEYIGGNKRKRKNKNYGGHFMTITEAAARLKLPEAAIHRLIGRGMLPFKNGEVPNSAIAPSVRSNAFLLEASRQRNEVAAEQAAAEQKAKATAEKKEKLYAELARLKKEQLEKDYIDNSPQIISVCDKLLALENQQPQGAK